jgi:glycosyltransferase involved in cell wall biosynthesis
LKRICILTQSHLCRNPRVVKEAYSLAKAGYKVLILTAFSSNEFLQEDLALISKAAIEYRQVADVRQQDISSFFLRLNRRIAGELVSRLGIETPNALGYSPSRFLQAAREIKADLYIAHQELALWVGSKLINEGRKVAFDLEDWHSEDLLPADRHKRPLKLLKKIESHVLSYGTYCITTSQAMANAMAAAYRCQPPKVIYNAFSLSERGEAVSATAVEKEKIALHWFSQTIGPGRGLEMLLKALLYINKPIQVHLRGTISSQYREALYQSFPLSKGHELYIHPLVPPATLVNSISVYHIGLALEESSPASRNLTVTNKILQYLLAGIPVIASDTEGQKEIAAQAPAAVFLFSNDNPVELAERVNELIQSPVKLRVARISAKKAANRTFCWEIEEKKLLKLVDAALQSDTKPAKKSIRRMPAF